MGQLKTNLLRVTLAVAAACGAQTATAVVLNFDDLNGYLPPGPPDIQEEWFTATYNGLQFGDLSPSTNSWFYSQRAVPGVYRPSSGNTFAATDFAVYTPGALLESLAAGQTITSTSDFVFNGAAFSGKDQIQYKLYNNGSLVYTSAIYNIALDTPAFYASGYAGLIDEIDILGTQGYYAMDDFDFTPTAVPEPNGLALVLAAGAAGALVSRRRKR